MSCNCQPILNAAATLTACECKGAGYCPRIGCTLNEYGYSLCRSDVGYFDLWKKSGAPCMEGAKDQPPQPFGLGDGLAWIIRVATFGKVKPCTGCKSRVAWLNSKLTLWRSRR